jgi:hypothetical protein
MHNSENKSIKCTVDSCKHHDYDGYCDLHDITVGCCNSDQPHSSAQTECMSFEDGSTHC